MGKLIKVIINLWFYFVGIGLIPLGWWTMWKIFKFIYPNQKLSERIFFLPRHDCIQIINNKLTVYFRIINLSCISINLTGVGIRFDDLEPLTTFHVESEAGETDLIRRRSIRTIRFEKDLGIDHRDRFYLKNESRVGLTIKFMARHRDEIKKSFEPFVIGIKHGG